MEQRSTLEGTVVQVVFQNEENGYAVLRLVSETGEVHTLVGTVPCPAVGEHFSCTGAWETHPQHGEQFRAEEIERLLPEEEEEIEEFLASGSVKGIGRATAERIVSRFGKDSLYILAEEPGRLSEIKGITAKKAQEMSESFRTRLSLGRLMDFLARYELPMSTGLQLYRRYGAGAAEAVQSNPYLLAGEEYGVRFSTADSMALSLGFSADSTLRLRAALLFELQHNEKNGHVFLPREKLLAAATTLIGESGEKTEMALDSLIDRGEIVEKKVAGVQACYLYRMFEAELFVADSCGCCFPLRQSRGEMWITFYSRPRSCSRFPMRPRRKRR